jgi:hypothetical protein
MLDGATCTVEGDQMTSIGDEPLGASLEAPAPTARSVSRRKRHSLIATYPEVEDSTHSDADRRWGPGKTAGFIFASAAVLWAVIFGLIAILH